MNEIKVTFNRGVDASEAFDRRWRELRGCGPVAFRSLPLMSHVDHRRFRVWICSLLLVFVHGVGAPVSRGAEAEPENEIGDVTKMAAFSVNGERLEDFGFRVSRGYDAERSGRFWPVSTPVVDVLLPNTAATKAGMRPGDRIVSSDGQSTAGSIFSANKWRRIQEKKWAEVAAGKKNVTWTLEVETAGTKERRTLKLVVPTPSPHWGASVWSAPEDRRPATVPEAGPLAERAKQILDHGIWILLRASYVRGFDLPISAQRPYFLAYEWMLPGGGGAHFIYVSQQRGRTDIIFEVISIHGAMQASTVAPAAATGTLASPTTVFALESRSYLTSPSGALEKAWLLPRGGKQREIPLEEAREEFQAEMDFWLTKVGKVSPRWPLGLIATKPSIDAGAAAAPETPPAPIEAGARAAAFLKLPAATEEQRQMFSEALGKIGADEDRWAYTQTSHSIEDKHVTVMRVDPSKPDAERCTLLKVDGKRPTADDIKLWRDQGRDSSAALGELPPISSLVDGEDVRVVADERAAVVFELPLRAKNKEFPADRFQALFRVNKASRAFEDITVKLREAVRVAGVVKLTEAGMTVRFQTFDPAFAPQPVLLRGGGAVRVLLIKFSRDFEATRTDFSRVEPFTEPVAAEK